MSRLAYFRARRRNPKTGKKIRAYARALYWRNRSRIQKQRRDWRLEQKRRLEKIKDVPCPDCGRKFPPLCMDFDHRPGVKKIRCVSKMIQSRTTWAKIEAEVKKCDVVCACCHRIRTEARRGLTKGS